MNVYSNVPIKEPREIIKLICDHNGHVDKLSQEIIQCCEILIQQNYFQCKDLQEIQEYGLAVGAPVSSIFFRNLFATSWKYWSLQQFMQHHLVGYFIYVSDIFMVCWGNSASIYEVLNVFCAVYCGRRVKVKWLF
jgi:hypothetical protein